ncbi:MAG: hypothetical protein FWG14_10165 [Peptococcaceae bacterium]|nr:hypothetical protein [Peptococcaceae bacterium]
MLTQERAEKLSEILNADPEQAKALLALEPAEALSQINALGNDFTLEEVNEFGKALKAQGELDDDALDDVSGGIAPLIAGAIVAGCSLISFNLSRNAPW